SIDKYFGTWKKSDNLSYPQYAPVKELTAPRDTTVVGQEAAFMMMGWNFPGSASAEIDTLQVIDHILANGKAGLFDLNINQKMKCQYAASMLDGMNEYSQFILYGMPMPGQSLKDVRDIMLAEIEKLKKGEFSDDLLPSVINNIKLDYNNSLESNEWRANEFVDAFINHETWQDKVNYINRISKITK
ncbi:MAG TPA: peptidase M16, partial [Prevotella sp.]|nr:peptidase M16 [Prevotella sp.]